MEFALRSGRREGRGTVAMTVSVDNFLDQLSKSRIVPAKLLREFSRSDAARGAQSPMDLAVAAVREQVLTRFQAEEILNGRGRRLIVGNYVLLDVLGYGGMGTVFIGRHKERDERYAVKLLGEQHKHEAGIRARFRLEARAGMMLNHPRLVKTYDLGVLQDLYGESDYMVMELMQGVTLLEGISFSAGPMKWDAACDVICQAAEGLAYLHERGMVHRDVKPDNILVDMEGEAKLLDFGLTLVDQTGSDDEFSLSMIFGQDCLGTADFIPPEQSLDSLNVDGRADIYSLGCTLFVALTAQRPFPGRNRIATVRAHRTEPRPRVDKLNDQVPRDLADIVEKMMAVEPRDRPPNMLEVVKLLSRFRRRRNWTFEFQQVLLRRRELKRKLLTQSKLSSLQAGRPTRLAAHLETDAPGKHTADRPEPRAE